MISSRLRLPQLLNTDFYQEGVVVSVQRSKGLLILLLLLVAPFVHAAYSVTVNPIQSEIYRNESASYDIIISNFENREGDFQVYTIDPGFTTKTEPLSLTVPAGSQRTFKLFLRPSTTARAGTQGIPVNFKDLNSGTVISKSIELTLRGYDRREYLPTVSLDVRMPYEIDPRAVIPVRLELRNRNPLNITNLTIRLFSPHFSATSVLHLAPLSDKTKDIEGLSMSPLTSPGEAEVTIQLVYEDEVITQIIKNYKVKEYTEVKQEVAEDKLFFKTEKTVTITNDGNVKNTAIIAVPTSFLKSLFISSSLPYEHEVRNGERVIFWSVPLEPQGTASVVYTENYRILVLLLLLGLISIVAYLLLRSPVVALKEAVAVAHPEGVSDIKVRVFVKNRSSKVIQGLQVTDRVPSLAEVVKTESHGSLSPTKVAVSEKHGTLLRWDLEVLEPFEERIFTYQVKSKLKIIGRMKLPNAKVRFMLNNKERAVYSNVIDLVERFKDK